MKISDLLRRLADQIDLEPQPMAHEEPEQPQWDPAGEEHGCGCSDACSCNDAEDTGDMQIIDLRRLAGMN